MQGDSNLDQPLQEFLLVTMRFTPNVLPDLVSVVELLPVEKLDPAMKGAQIHGQMLAG